ncbi:MAG: class I SAM-dependent methyltransferase [Rhodospirillaceae bacterium]|nr:class I SAM-dependent methyltransferase [Rhodospirillaceae bacterium]
MTGDTSFEGINEAKADWGHIYNRFDPRSYSHELDKLDYVIPDNAKPIFQKLIGHLQQRRGDTVHILDLGCSYGINSATLKHDLSMDELNKHWGQKKMMDASSDEVVAYDQQFFSDSNVNEDIEMVGLDQAENAIAYGLASGLLDEGLAVDLETEPLSALAKEKLAPTDLVTSTGCVGYLTEKSFDRLLPAVNEGQQPWIANFVLRLFPFDVITKSLDKWGYVTEKLDGQTFFQRKFASDDEQKQVLEQLSEQGVDPTGKEDEGHFLAEFYLSRPMKDAAEVPIERLLQS